MKEKPVMPEKKSFREAANPFKRTGAEDIWKFLRQLDISENNFDKLHEQS